MKKRGQPTKQNRTKMAQKRKLFLESYKLAGFNISETCRKTEIARRIVYEWLEDPEFKQDMENAREELIDLVELELQKQIRKGSAVATIYFLNCQGKDRGWSQKQEVHHEHSGTIHHDLTERLEKAIEATENAIRGKGSKRSR